MLRAAKTKFVIMAGGQEKRWRRYRGVHKHLIPIDGERILDRTVRLIRERTDADITIVAF